MDPWIGYKWRHILPPFVIEKLHLARFYFLSDIGIPGLTCLMFQQWLTAEFIGFTDPQEIAVWNGYIAILKASHVRFSNDDDALVWNLSKIGHYLPKEGYAQLMVNREVDYIWWWKVLWKLKCPLKTKQKIVGLSYLEKL